MAKFRLKPMIVEAITFDELIAYGLTQTDNIYNNRPWSFKYKGVPIYHETDYCYLIGGTEPFTENHLLIIKDNDVSVVEKDAFELMSESLEE